MTKSVVEKSDLSRSRRKESQSPKANLLIQVAQKGADKGKIARTVIAEPELLATVMAGLEAEKAAVRFGCAGVLLALSELKPELVYPSLDRFAGLLNSENSILQWVAIRILANLAKVDSDNRLEALFDRYFAPITGPAMITAAQVMAGGAKIARAKPRLAGPIAAEILKVARAHYQTEECRNVAIGHAVKAFDEFIELMPAPGPVERFVRKQLHNTRPATRKKAERFLKKHGE